ncbi:unnamed protein product [Schistosoma mattheei]|uniref:Uncharacterized protein n=1 Tax=Schistosoma mattheei TaxID=31246 RepID=A0A183NIW9_9TREM|nr:unnamed protein product [Schistosoma mattheei]
MTKDSKLPTPLLPLNKVKLVLKELLDIQQLTKTPSVYSVAMDHLDY